MAPEPPGREAENACQPLVQRGQPGAGHTDPRGLTEPAPPWTTSCGASWADAIPRYLGRRLIRVAVAQESQRQMEPFRCLPDDVRSSPFPERRQPCLERPRQFRPRPQGDEQSVGCPRPGHTRSRTSDTTCASWK